MHCTLYIVHCALRGVTVKINDKTLSRLTLGTARYGGSIDKQASFSLIDTYRELGGNTLDTARVYGESESTIGKYLTSRCCRNQLIIATKGAHYNTTTKEKRVSKRDIEFDIELSLKNLNTDYVDMYWLHRDDEDIPAGEIIEMTAMLIKSGKALAIGVSNWRPERIAEANSYAQEHNLPQFIASQIKHSAAVTVRENDSTILSLTNASRPFYKKEKMPIFAFTSQARGLFSKLETQGDNSLSEWLAREFICEETLRRYAEIKNLASDLHRPISQVALASIICDPELEIIPIIGGRTPDQITDSFKALEIQLSEEQFCKILKG